MINSYVLQEFPSSSSHHPWFLVILYDTKVGVMLYGGIFWKSSINFKLKGFMIELCISCLWFLYISQGASFSFFSSLLLCNIFKQWCMPRMKTILYIGGPMVYMTHSIFPFFILCDNSSIYIKQFLMHRLYKLHWYIDSCFRWNFAISLWFKEKYYYINLRHLNFVSSLPHISFINLPKIRLVCGVDLGIGGVIKRRILITFSIICYIRNTIGHNQNQKCYISLQHLLIQL